MYKLAIDSNLPSLYHLSTIISSIEKKPHLKNLKTPDKSSLINSWGKHYYFQIPIQIFLKETLPAGIYPTPVSRSFPIYDVLAGYQIIWTGICNTIKTTVSMLRKHQWNKLYLEACMNLYMSNISFIIIIFTDNIFLIFIDE